MRFPIAVQLLYSVQTLPDSSDKLGPVAVTFQTKRRPNRLSFSFKKRLGIKLHNRSTSPKLRKTVSIPEVILQSTFSRNAISLSKQKQMNVHIHNSTTIYFDDEMSGVFYSCELTLLLGANTVILKICATMYQFPDPVTFVYVLSFIKICYFSHLALKLEMPI